MLDFSFEVLNEHNIAIEYKYGSEFFTFNLYFKLGVWTLHPFQGVLLQNKDMCRLVVSDLLKHKEFHIMLIKQHIPISAIRTSIDLDPGEGRAENRVRAELDAEPGPGAADDIDVDDFIASHTLDELIEQEKLWLEERIVLYKDILQKMFLDGYGPEDEDFAKMQTILRAYTDTADKLNTLLDPGYGGGSLRRF